MTRGKLSAYTRWINDYEAVSSLIAKHDVERAVDANGGLVRIENFFPEFVAEGILATVAAIPEKAWNDTSASKDYRHNNISHSFLSVKQASGLDAVLRMFSLVRPDSLNAFSAAKYCKQDHIAPHDDRAYTQVKLDNGRIITTSRTLAIIYYLTRDWREEYGGVLVDLEDPTAPPGVGRKYVPKWNSVVAFRVPRYHAVTALTTDRPRYSIFGWFLEPGKLYDLYRGDNSGGQAAGAERPAAAATLPGGAAAAGAAVPQHGARQASSGKRQREAAGPDGHPSGPSGRAGAENGTGHRQPAHEGCGQQQAAHGRQPQKAEPFAQEDKAEEQQRRRGPPTGQRASRRRGPEGGVDDGLAGQGGTGRPDGVELWDDALGGLGAREATALPMRLPSRWQGRRKHMCIS